MLYIVATPIGNLKDITLRALEILKNSDLIITENPRNSLKLLNHFEIGSKKILQFSEPNETKALGNIIELLKSHDGALITDAGTPSVSDPGFRLVRACVANNIAVQSIPGPSAPITALAASGLPTDRFIFVGFLPKTEHKIKNILELAKSAEATLIAFESPFRIVKSIKTIAESYPDANVVVARELTKIHEEFIRGKAKDLKLPEKIKGEITLLISFK